MFDKNYSYAASSYSSYRVTRHEQQKRSATYVG